MRGAASPTFRSDRRPTTSTAPIGSAPTSSARRSSRSMRARASACGTSSSCTTTCGTSIPSAAPQLTTIRHNGRNRDVVVVASKTTWLYVFDRVTGEPIWPIEERPVPKSDMPGEQSWPTQPYPTNPPPFGRQSFGVDDISPYLPADEADALKNAAARGQEPGSLHADQLLATRCTSRRATAACSSAAWRPNRRTRRRLRRHARQPRHPAPAAPRRDRRPRRRAAGAARAGGLSAELPELPRSGSPGHGQRRARSSTRRRIRPTTSRPGAPRFDAAAIRAVLERRQGADAGVSASDRRRRGRLVAFLTSAPAGGAGAAARRARRSARRSGAPPELIVGSGSVWTRPAAAGRARTRRAAAVSRRRPAVRAAGDQRIQHGRQPHRAAVHVDREVRPERAGDHSGASASATIPRWPRAASPARACPR